MFENFSREEAEKIIQEQEVKRQLEKEAIEEGVYKGLALKKPSYELFKTNFKEMNPDLTEEDFRFMFVKKRGVPFIKFSRVTDNNYKLPAGSCVGVTILNQKQVYGAPMVAYFKGRKIHRIYQQLSNPIIGAVPVGVNEYLLIARKRFTSFNFIFPIVFTLISLSMILSLFA